MTAKKKVVEEKIKLYRRDLGIKLFPKSKKKSLIENGEWSIPTAKQIKGA